MSPNDMRNEIAIKAISNFLWQPLGTMSSDTAERWVKMINEMTGGENVDVRRLFKTFDGIKYDGMVVVGPIRFGSLCEHHLLPFTGDAWVGYLPGRSGRVVGLSKLARLVEAHALRLQVQERMTQNIAQDIMKHLEADGSGVRIESQHSCMSCRGVKKEAAMRTQTLLGSFREAHVKQEFTILCQRGS